MSTATGRARKLLSVAALLAVSVSTLPASTAAGATAAPTGLAVTQHDGTTIVLSWTGVAAATSYDVVIDNDGDFSSPFFNATTVNTTSVASEPMRSGTNYWRVRARSGSDVSDWSIGSIDAPAVGKPVAVGPPDGDSLSQPDEPPLLSWAPVQGATEYFVEVDNDTQFVNPLGPFSTKSTSLVVPSVLAKGTWYWRVIASRGAGLVSLPSDYRSLVIEPIDTPALVSPANGVDSEVEDVVMRWKPVVGARSYEIEVSTDEDFSPLADSKTDIVGTSYAPQVTYDNTQYYWRVRALDADNQATDWSTPFTFWRRWGDFTDVEDPSDRDDRKDVPTPLFPAASGREVVSGPVSFAWEPAQRASEYELLVGTTSTFSPGTFKQCRTAGTTYTPAAMRVNLITGGAYQPSDDQCTPYHGMPTFWKVKALDRPFTKGGVLPGVQGEWSAVHEFVWQENPVSTRRPVDGTTGLEVPTLSWDAVLEADSYALTIADNTGARVVTANTRSTSYTPTQKLTAAKSPYTWTVQAKRADGLSFFVSSEWSFSVVDTPSVTSSTWVNTSSANPSVLAPRLSWQPITGAAKYKVNFGPAGLSVWFGHQYDDLFGQDLAYPSLTDPSARLLEPGTYDWQVTAYNGTGGVVSTSPEFQFTVAPLGSVTGQRLALTSPALNADGGCTARLNADGVSGPKCNPVAATPVLAWDPVPGASYYLVYVADDAAFTNKLEADTTFTATANTMFAPSLSARKWAYPDNTAGQAYYWAIRPCKSNGLCADDLGTGSATNAFVKKSPPVEPVLPEDGITLTNANDITFDWVDYVETNRTLPAATTPAQVLAEQSVTLEQGQQAAMQYRIQVDTDTAFQAPFIDEQVVDQPTYTSYQRLYPDGPLYWRVQAIDSQGHGLAWSATRSLIKQSPAVQLVAPSTGSTVSGSSPFRWKATSSTSRYALEIYRNNDQTFSSANRAVSVTTKSAAYATDLPLSPSAQPYVWRVRRIDSKDNPGQWSATGTFMVDGGALQLTSPSDNSSLLPDQILLDWQPLVGATRYRVEVTSVTSGQTMVSTTTAASAYAPTDAYKTGTYRWRITALDTTGNALGSSQRTFSVDAGLVAVVPPVIQAPTGSAVGQTLTSISPTWNRSDVSISYQWLRDGNPIYGANAPVYVLVVDDYTRALSLRVTGKKAGYEEGTTVSNAIGATAGGALLNTAAPGISGTAAVGSILVVSQGSWSLPYPTVRYQWTRDGAPIPNATSASYGLKPEDAGRSISATVLASTRGFSEGAASAAPVSVPKMKSTTTAALSATRVKKGKRVKIGITVAVPGVTGPIGTVKVYDGAKVLKTLPLSSVRLGKIGWKMTKLKPGKHKMKAVFLGNGTTLGSKSKIVKLIVTK